MRGVGWCAYARRAADHITRGALTARSLRPRAANLQKGALQASASSKRLSMRSSRDSIRSMRLDIDAYCLLESAGPSFNLTQIAGYSIELLLWLAQQRQHEMINHTLTFGRMPSAQICWRAHCGIAGAFLSARLIASLRAGAHNRAAIFKGSRMPWRARQVRSSSVLRSGDVAPTITHVSVGLGLQIGNSVG